jgi:hypothetical protein
MRATVFLAPSFIEDRDEYRPHLDDVHQGNDSLETVLHRERGSQPFVTWEEISEMASSGALNFESHSYEHSLVFTSPKIVDFVRPELKAAFDVLELRISTTGGEPPTVKSLPLGAPLYTTAPRLSGKARYFDDAGLRNACAEYVAQRGGDSFFSRPDWRQDLASFVASYRERNPFDDRYEDPEETRESIRCDLAKSIEAIEDRPGCDSVNYLAFPWAVGSKLAVHEAQNLGLQGCFWEKTDDKYVNEQGQNPLYFRRMGADFLHLLPGEGRESLVSMTIRKLKRRLRNSSPYITH